MTGVVMLVNEFPPQTVGGAERQAERLAAALAQLGVDVGVMARSGPELPPWEEREGFWVRRIAPWGPGKWGTLTFILGTMAYLWRIRQRYQILHAHLAFGPAVAAALVAPWLGKKVVVKFGNSGPFGDVQVSQATWRGRLKLALLRRRADVVVALDETMARELHEAGFDPRRIVRLDNGIPVEAFRPTLPRRAYRRIVGVEGRDVLVFVGRLAPQKGLDLLLRALVPVFAQRPQACLMLVGEGPERPALEALARELGITDQVCFLGYVEDVAPYLWAGDVFVLPSWAEGMSNALLEAMAAGMACVVTAVGQGPEMLDQGRCGVVVPPGDPQALTEALLALLASPDLRRRLGQAAQRRVAERYAMRRVAAAYLALYERLR